MFNSRLFHCCPHGLNQSTALLATQSSLGARQIQDFLISSSTRMKKPTTQHIGMLNKKPGDDFIPGGSRRPLDAEYESAITLSTRFAAPNWDSRQRLHQPCLNQTF
jgi:hypothetical protein